MKRLFRRLILFVALIFVAPSLAHLAVWIVRDRPANWREADWSSARILPEARADSAAEVYVMSARTGGLKGAVSKHSWIVLKKPGADHYDRYDVVGWGNPVRKNAFPADGKWYSNLPEVRFRATDQQAAKLVPAIEKAIASYRWRNYGDYTIWPGPNSNTFVASIIRSVPGFSATLPSTAIGKDYYASGDLVRFDVAGKKLHLSLFGYAGLSFDKDTGIEINLLGLVIGYDWLQQILKLPGFGEISSSIGR